MTGWTKIKRQWAEDDDVPTKCTANGIAVHEGSVLVHAVRQSDPHPWSDQNVVSKPAKSATHAPNTQP